MASSPPPTTTPRAPHLGPIVDDRTGHDRFDTHELALVLSHWDLGVIKRIRPYPRGSRRAPKLRLTTELGELLLKRRAPGRDDPQRVAFAQDLQLFLAAHDYPLPPLIATRQRRSSMLQLHGRIYEMFGFVEGDRDDRSHAAAREAGRALGLLHRLLRAYESPYTPPAASFHQARALVDNATKQIPAMVAAAEPAAAPDELNRRCQLLRNAYHDATQRAELAGIADFPPCVLHGDWHPGNLLYRDGRIVAVLDFDSARIEPRMVDVANAALQFSMRTSDGEDPEQWPEALEVKRIRALLDGYHESAEEPISETERQSLPWLILEALIVETVIPIAATGRFAMLKGSSFLGMVERKVHWLRPRAKKLIEFIENDT
jgi:homoserine kinase type II